MCGKMRFYEVNSDAEQIQTKFSPKLLPLNPHVFLDYEGLLLLENTSNKLKIFNQMTETVPNIKNYLRMLLKKAAVASVQLEGHEIDFLQFLNPETNKYNSAGFYEAINYLNTIDFLLFELESKSINNKFIREIHSSILQTAKNANSVPGKFRESDGFVIKRFKSGKEIKHILPSFEIVIPYMLNLEKFINSEASMHPLVKSALIQFQIAMIHPFPEFNSQISRLISMAYLIKTKTVGFPSLSITSYFQENDEEYYDSFIYSLAYNRHEKWVKFFLKALYRAADAAINTLIEMINLQNANIEKVLIERKLVNISFALLTYFELHPIVELNQMTKELGISPDILNRVIKMMSELDILSYVTKDNTKRVKRVYCDKYIEIITKEH